MLLFLLQLLSPWWISPWSFPFSCVSSIIYCLTFCLKLSYFLFLFLEGLFHFCFSFLLFLFPLCYCNLALGKLLSTELLPKLGRTRSPSGKLQTHFLLSINTTVNDGVTEVQRTVFLGPLNLEANWMSETNISPFSVFFFFFCGLIPLLYTFLAVSTGFFWIFFSNSSFLPLKTGQVAKTLSNFMGFNAPHQHETCSFLWSISLWLFHLWPYRIFRML